MHMQNIKFYAGLNKPWAQLWDLGNSEADSEYFAVLCLSFHCSCAEA